MLAPDATGEVADDELEAPEWVMDEGPADDEAEEDEDAAPDGDYPAQEGLVSLSEADFDELHGLGMSITQAKRVIRYREERGGFQTLDELDRVPGFPRNFLDSVKGRLVP